MKVSSWVFAAGMAILVLALAWQQRSISRLQAAVEEAATAVTVTVPAAAPRPRVEREPEPRAERVVPMRVEPDMVSVGDEGLAVRLAALERSVASLNAGAEHLMDRGQMPPSDAKAAEWRGILMDAAQSPDERIAALRMLRRNGLFDENAARTAATWLQATSDPNEQRRLLEHLRGADSPVLKQVMLSLASTSDDARVRERAVGTLRGYGEDAQVEAALWQMVASDESRDVRRRAVDTLRRFPMNDARAAELRAGALDPYAPIETRVASMTVLQSGNQDISDIAAPMAVAAAQVSDSQSLLEYIQAFDDVNHPEFMVPLVAAAQDEDAAVRLRAADALVDYRRDPVIQEWLVHLAENDPDPEVRREASRIYRQDGRRDGRWMQR